MGLRSLLTVFIIIYIDFLPNVLMLEKELPAFLDLNDLSGSKNGGQILFATDDFFAVAENLLKDEEPEWHEGEYTEFGKWMDGWETRRKRIAGHDWCIIKLGVPGVIGGIHIDTAFFIGNFAPQISIQAAKLSEEDEAQFPQRYSEMGTAATENMIEEASILSNDWTEILSFTELLPGNPKTRHQYFKIQCNETWTHLRLNLYPDGGVARMRVYGVAKPDWNKCTRYEETDLVAFVNGGLCVNYSNAHFGHPRNMIRPGKGIGMFDGWETARRIDRPPVIKVNKDGLMDTELYETATFQLGHIGTIHRIVVDTTHFKGNPSDSVWIDGANINDLDNLDIYKNWVPVLKRSKLAADSVHIFTEIIPQGPLSHIRVSIAPDGGISRIRVWGMITDNY